MSVIITDFKKQYHEQVIHLLDEILNQEYGLGVELALEADLQDICGTYQVEKGGFWVALIENEVVGTLGLLDINFHNVNMRRMYVKKSYRGQPWNIGRGLILQAEQHCQENEIKTITLATATYLNAAHRFYKSNGFLLIEEKKLPKNFKPFPSDTIFYQKKIV